MRIVVQVLGGRERAMIEYMPALGAGLLTISIVALDCISGSDGGGSCVIILADAKWPVHP
jgi:hypothetical protein